jgi:hypothetical protein
VAIPAFNKHGLLPEGIHDCSLEELRDRFGTFQSSDRRPRLWQRLRQFIEELRQSHLIREVLIDGSFVTNLPSPNDIDLILVLPLDHDIYAELTPSAYNVISKTRVRVQFEFDIFVVGAESIEYRMALGFFARVRNRPQLRKGILRLQL